MLKLFILVVLGVSVHAIDWCQMEAEFCDGEEHIACEPNSFGTPTNVRNIQVVQLSDADKQSIVDRHNNFRRKVAQGQESGLPSASKMEEMYWDDNLAFVAGEHVKHGNFEHDQCRASTAYPSAGQNLATGSSSVAYSSIIAQVLGHVDMWYNKEMPIVRDDMPSCVGTFTLSPNCLKAGHFTAVVKESSFAVGCAVATFETQIQGNWWYSVLTTCDYANTNMLDEAVYTQGTTCSACGSIGKTCSNGLCA
uniref:Putative antigen 5-like salivary protein n=1 Tax=Phlebotomus kandelakii TaxID=1109342 RepID=A0A6B2E6R9_9DIPT